MSRNYFYYILYLILVLTSCDVRPSKTEIFKDYLHCFNLKIPYSTNLYILVPKEGCQGAIFNTLKYFSALNTCHFTIISPNIEINAFFQNSDSNWIIDKTNEMSRLKLPIYNTTLVITEKGEVKKIVSSKYCEASPESQFDPYISLCQ